MKAEVFSSLLVLNIQLFIGTVPRKKDNRQQFRVYFTVREIINKWGEKNQDISQQIQPNTILISDSIALSLCIIVKVCDGTNRKKEEHRIITSLERVPKECLFSLKRTS